MDCPVLASTHYARFYLQTRIVITKSLLARDRLMVSLLRSMGDIQLFEDDELALEDVDPHHACLIMSLGWHNRCFEDISRIRDLVDRIGAFALTGFVVAHRLRCDQGQPPTMLIEHSDFFRAHQQRVERVGGEMRVDGDLARYLSYAIDECCRYSDRQIRRRIDSSIERLKQHSLDSECLHSRFRRSGVKQPYLPPDPLFETITGAEDIACQPFVIDTSLGHPMLVCADIWFELHSVAIIACAVITAMEDKAGILPRSFCLDPGGEDLVVDMDALMRSIGWYGDRSYQPDSGVVSRWPLPQGETLGRKWFNLRRFLSGIYKCDPPEQEELFFEWLAGVQ